MDDMEATPVKKMTLGNASATTVRELINALEELVAPQNADTTFVTLNSDSIRLTLVEETLTDSSKVYNIELTEVAKTPIQSGLVFFKRYEVVTAKYKSGEEVNLYGYPVTQDGVTIGVVVPGRSNKSYHAYHLAAGVITESFNYKTRKDAFACFQTLNS